MSRYLKTIIAALVAGLTAAQAAISDERITNNEWIIIALAVLGAVGVYLVPNSPPAGEPADPNMSERGHSTVEVVLISGLVAVVVVVLFVFFR